MADYIALQYFVFLQKDLATFTTNEGLSFLISGIWRTVRSSKHLRHPKRREIRRKRLPQDSWREIRPMELLILFTVREFSKYNAGSFHYSFFIMFEIIHFPTKIYIKLWLFYYEIRTIIRNSGNDALNDPICHWATWPAIVLEFQRVRVFTARVSEYVPSQHRG